MKRIGQPLVGILLLAASAAVGQNERTEVPVAPGLTYLRLQRPGPVVAHVLKADLAERSLTPAVVMAGQRVLDTEPLGDLVQRYSEGRTVAGALNGGVTMTRSDPYQGTPIGLLVADGELLCDPWPTPRSALVLSPEGKPRIELLGLRGKVGGSDGKAQRLAGLNRRRLPGEIVCYTPRFNPATRVVDAGQQLVLSGCFPDGGRLLAGQNYQGTVRALVDGQVNIEIPPDGVVLAGSGPAASWLQGRKIGETVSFSFELVPDVGRVASAVGSGPRLVRDGEVSVEAEQEKLAIARATGRQPRSAVGYNEKYLFLVAVDGRNVEHSVGCNVDELAKLLVELSCSQAMLLDGGGATTMYARDRVINQPSDGLPRGLGNALLLFTSGRLSDRPLPGPTVSGGGAAPPLRPETTQPGIPAPDLTPTIVEPTTAVTPPAGSGVAAKLHLGPDPLLTTVGTSSLLALGAESAAGTAVAVTPDQVTFEVDPAALGTVEGGRFTAAKMGQGRILVRQGNLVAAVVVRIGPAVKDTDPVTPTPPAPGGEPSRTVVLRPDGTEEPVPQPTGLTPGPAPSKPPTATATTPQPPKSPVAPAGGASQPTAPRPPKTPDDSATAAPGAGQAREAPQVPDGERRGIDGFENPAHWTAKVYPTSVVGSVAVVKTNLKLQGNCCLKFDYDFTTITETRAVYALYETVIGFPKAVSVYVFGDGKGHWLRGQFRDKTGTKYQVDFAEFVNWDHQWRRCTAVIPPGVKGPLTWESIYLVQHRPEVQSAGTIYLDQLEGIY
ncbi:MAG: phosphodiester glycosidase family protein [Fimbriimonadaceae bacterium]|nr:phosphodiester glycosidase family protein [Fimbriimonadaceae bacterium]